MFCLPLFLNSWVSGDKLFSINYILRCNWRLCFVCLRICVYVYNIVLCVCESLEWCLCLVEKIIAHVQSMKCDNLFIDSCSSVVFPKPLSFSLFGWVCVCLTWFVDRCVCVFSMGYFCVRRLHPVWGETLFFAKRGMFLSFLPLLLFNDSDIATNTRLVIVGSKPDSTAQGK